MDFLISGSYKRQDLLFDCADYFDMGNELTKFVQGWWMQHTEFIRHSTPWLQLLVPVWQAFRARQWFLHVGFESRQASFTS